MSEQQEYEEALWGLQEDESLDEERFVEEEKSDGDQEHYGAGSSTNNFQIQSPALPTTGVQGRQIQQFAYASIEEMETAERNKLQYEFNLAFANGRVPRHLTQVEDFDYMKEICSAMLSIGAVQGEKTAKGKLRQSVSKIGNKELYTDLNVEMTAWRLLKKAKQAFAFGLIDPRHKLKAEEYESFDSYMEAVLNSLRGSKDIVKRWLDPDYERQILNATQASIKDSNRIQTTKYNLKLNEKRNQQVVAGKAILADRSVLQAGAASNENIALVAGETHMGLAGANKDRQRSSGSAYRGFGEDSTSEASSSNQDPHYTHPRSSRWPALASSSQLLKPSTYQAYNPTQSHRLVSNTLDRPFDLAAFNLQYRSALCDILKVSRKMVNTYSLNELRVYARAANADFGDFMWNHPEAWKMRLVGQRLTLVYHAQSREPIWHFALLLTRFMPFALARGDVLNGKGHDLDGQQYEQPEVGTPGFTLMDRPEDGEIRRALGLIDNPFGMHT